MSDLIDITLPSGDHATVPQGDLAQALAAGASLRGTAPAASPEDGGGLLGQVAAGVLGAGSTATLGLTDKLAREIPYIVGGPKASREVTSQLRMVRERNPYSTMVGEVGGLLANPAAFEGAGELATEALAPRVGTGLIDQAAITAARVGAETALGGAQHAITEESLGDHDLNAQAIWSQAAKEGMLGVAGGAALGFGGGLLGKAGDATGLLARRSGPMSAATIDEIAGVEGAGAGVRDQAAHAEKTIEGLRATGATTDQAVDMVEGLNTAAKGRAASEPIGKNVVDSAADEYISRIAAKNPERAEILRQHYADALKPIESGTTAVDRTALDMSKSGTGFLRNGEDIANEAQFTMKPERFAKLVDTSRLQTQTDEIARLLQDTDGMLSFWESTASKGGLEGGIAKLRRQWTDVYDTLHNLAANGESANLSRDLFIRANKFKQQLDRYVPYGRIPGAVIDGKASMYGLPEAVVGTGADDGILPMANRWRKMLEDETVWGDAGTAQARENLSFSDMKARFEHFKSQFGESIDQKLGVRIPEIDFTKTRGVLDKITGDANIDEALQPIKSARATIDGMRQRISDLHTGGELTESQTTKLAQAEKDVSAFESSLNGAMKEAAKENRLKAAVLEEGHSAMGGLLGAALDTVNRPLATMKRLAQIKHTYEKVTGGVKSALEDVFKSGGGSSTEGVAARAAAPRPKEKSIEEMQNIRAIAGNPAALEAAAARMTGGLSSYAPQTANALRLTAMRALLYLAREAPPASVSGSGTFGEMKPRYSDMQIHDWETKRNAAYNPADVVVDMKHGRLNREAITTAKYVAPQMFAMMQDLARDQIAAMSARGELDRMPYQQKAVIANLLEVPADRTFEPDFVAMMQAAKAQPAPVSKPAPTNGAQPVKKSNQKPMADMFMTASGQIEAGGQAL